MRKNKILRCGFSGFKNTRFQRYHARVIENFNEIKPAENHALLHLTPFVINNIAPPFIPIAKWTLYILLLLKLPQVISSGLHQRLKNCINFPQLFTNR